MENDMQFTDISSEERRTYVFDQRRSVIIDRPVKLNVSASGGHRILDETGTSHYVPSGWVHLFWTVKEGQPHFVA